MYRSSSPAFAAELAGDIVPLNYLRNQTSAARPQAVYEPQYALQPPNVTQPGSSNSFSSISPAGTETPQWQYTVSQPVSAISTPESTSVWNQRPPGGVLEPPVRG